MLGRGVNTCLDVRSSGRGHDEPRIVDVAIFERSQIEPNFPVFRACFDLGNGRRRHDADLRARFDEIANLPRRHVPGADDEHVSVVKVEKKRQQSRRVHDSKVPRSKTVSLRRRPRSASGVAT